MALHGVALVDKPAGMSSFSVVSRIRRVFRSLGVSKAGHTGTLDPLATGLLPVCVGESTKFAQRLLDADKGYVATVKLGTATTTADAEGEITARSSVAVDAPTLHAALVKFRGTIEQVPPIYSALKINGKPAYAYARAGKPIELAARTVTIHSLELIAFRSDLQEFDIMVVCSKGTYIRSLAVDIALAAGSVGHLASLRRTRTGGFDLAAARPLDDWMDADDGTRMTWLKPTDSLVAELPDLRLDPVQSVDICNGKVVRLDSMYPFRPDVTAADGSNPDSDSGVEGGTSLIRLYDATGRFLGLGAKQADGTLRAERLLATGIDR